ncbi:MAG TPA: winged helix-turn-helix domain-containing protein [Patescibacteria group bacterium]|nr:winged helix-turn-helix domain-containing protein [Patescibacteria group bacterium]
MDLSHFESLYPENTRFTELEKILSFIKEGNSCQIVSVGGVGRSNLLGLLSYNTKVRLKHLGAGQKNFHFVNINLSEVKNKPNSEVTKFIFLELLDSLRERKLHKEYAEISKILKETIEFSDELVTFQGLKKTIDYLAIEKNLTVVLLFDRFEIFVSTATPDFFSNLRILRNRAKYHFSCIFSINKPLEDIFEKEFLADFYEFVATHTIYLPIIDKPGLDFRISYLQNAVGKKLPKKTIDDVVSQTGGHGKLTRICVELGLNGIEDFASQKPVQGVLLEILSSLDVSEQNALGKGASNSYLEEIGLSKNGKITIPLLQTFLRQNQSGNQKKGILFDPKTNQIKRGEQILSDNLTSSEFKLFKFLIENRNRILERQEIIESVWKDTKTRLGVTDQALDQLISRLRKKVEEDPNSPIHLLTIKGRGFKFQS